MNRRDKPLVSIGIPTHNRATSLGRTLTSVLAQDYRPLELIISDNASTDSTPDLCRELAKEYSWIRYSRSDTNLGPTANFNRLPGISRGDYYMWLADDDWLAENYISECLERLRSHSDYSLVYGAPLYYEGETFVSQGTMMALTQDAGTDRILQYYATVIDNGAFYGLMRRKVLGSLHQIPNVLGGDWLIVASMAFLGKIKSIHTTQINRSLGGSGFDFKKLAKEAGFGAIQMEYPDLSIATNAALDIIWRSPAFSSLALRERLRIGSACEKTIRRRLRPLRGSMSRSVLARALKVAPPGVQEAARTWYQGHLRRGRERDVH